MTISSFNDTNVYDEIKKLWSEKYIFSDGKGSDNVKWYGEVVAKKGHCNCPDYGMFVAYIAKKHGSKIAVADVGCEYITPMQQTYAGHILPAFYKAGRWYIVNYLGADGPFGIFYTEGKDDDKAFSYYKHIGNGHRIIFCVPFKQHCALCYRLNDSCIFRSSRYAGCLRYGIFTSQTQSKNLFAC